MVSGGVEEQKETVSNRERIRSWSSLSHSMQMQNNLHGKGSSTIRQWYTGSVDIMRLESGCVGWKCEA